MDVLRLSTHATEGAVTIRVAGELDIATIGELRSYVADVLAASFHRELILDLSDLQFIDASGLGALVGIRHRAQRQHVALALTGATARTRHLLTATRLAGHFKLT